MYGSIHDTKYLAISNLFKYDTLLTSLKHLSKNFAKLPQLPLSNQIFGDSSSNECEISSPKNTVQSSYKQSK